MKTFGNSESVAPGAGPETVEFRAAQWCDTLREEGDDPELRRAFERWYGADPAHAEAFDRIDNAYRTALAAGASRQMVALENEVLAEDAERDRRRARRYALGTAAAAGLVAVVVTGLAATGGSWQELQYLRDRALHALAGETLYRTSVGERLALVLEDGTELTLNTDSRVVVDYGETARNVRLARGQALFEVARNPDRPFVVDAGDRRVTALGTAFDMHLSEKRLKVTLIEGRVKVENAESKADSSEDPPPASRTTDAVRSSPHPTRAENAPLPSSGEGPSVSPLPLGGEGQGEGGSSRTTNNEQQTTILEPGQQLIVATADSSRLLAPAEPVIRQIDARRATSWRNGQVIFEEDPLAEAVEEINRYGGRRVVLAGEDIGDLRVSGIFKLGDTTVFVETLIRYFPLYVAEADENRIVLAQRRGRE